LGTPAFALKSGEGCPPKREARRRAPNLTESFGWQANLRSRDTRRLRAVICPFESFGGQATFAHTTREGQELPRQAPYGVEVSARLDTHLPRNHRDSRIHDRLLVCTRKLCEVHVETICLLPSQREGQPTICRRHTRCSATARDPQLWRLVVHGPAPSVETRCVTRICHRAECSELRALPEVRLRAGVCQAALRLRYRTAAPAQFAVSIFRVLRVPTYAALPEIEALKDWHVGHVMLFGVVVCRPTCPDHIPKCFRS